MGTCVFSLSKLENCMSRLCGDHVPTIQVIFFVTKAQRLKALNSVMPGPIECSEPYITTIYARHIFKFHNLTLKIVEKNFVLE